MRFAPRRYEIVSFVKGMRSKTALLSDTLGQILSPLNTSRFTATKSKIGCTMGERSCVVLQVFRAFRCFTMVIVPRMAPAYAGTRKDASRYGAPEANHTELNRELMLPNEQQVMARVNERLRKKCKSRLRGAHDRMLTKR